MNSFNRGKLSLSNNAVKVAARKLQETESHPAAASIAVRAALREDAQNIYELWHRDKSKGRIGVDASLTWVNGCAGSGKTELTYAAARHAARNGCRVVTLTTDHSYAMRWHDEDRVLVDLREVWPHSEDQIRSRIGPHLGNPGLINLTVLIPVLIKLPEELIGASASLRKYLIDHLPDKSLFVVDDLYNPFPPEPFLPGLREALQKTGSSAIISTQVVPERLSENIHENECQITMRLLDPPQIEYDHTNLREGMGYLHSNGEVIPIEGDYEFDLDPEKIHSGAIRKAILRLEKNLSEGECLSHISRLEAIARACGYRSWHAAQGRSG
ncbi:hypothetical protein [Pseudosulfitobacter pseudonitzschiae]|uniref:hypothetical protein n=1 Tax=Pseudosulfitobacter pseudonitzschiae TaxID=1402135 RepID=UPI003B76D8DC